MCVLVLILWGHVWPNGLTQFCYYDCGGKKYGYYDRRLIVNPDYVCPARFGEA